MKADFQGISGNPLKMDLFGGFRQKSPFFQNRESPLDRSYEGRLRSQNAKLIPEATDRKTVTLFGGGTGYEATVVLQKVDPCIVGIDLRRTPPVTVETNAVENTIAV
jgi:hypothetical protein